MVNIAVEPQVARLAHRADVLRYSTEREAGAKVRRGEDDHPSLENTWCSVALGTAAGVRPVAGGVAFALAFTAAVCACVANPTGEFNPLARVKA